MNKEITLRTLADRFRTFGSWDNDDVPERHNVFYQNNNSVGNRYINWKGVDAYSAYTGDGKVLDKESLYERVKTSPCDWHNLFNGIHYGLIVGPETLCAVDECLEILRNDKPPEDDGTKVRHVNHLGGVNHVSKPTLHSWDLTSRFGKMLAEAFFADRKNKLLYSEAFTYVATGHAGWSRST